MLGKICIVRTYSAGVFIGKVVERDGKEVRLTDARRLWYWEGAASLSQLANEGTKKPDKCKFPAPVRFWVGTSRPSAPLSYMHLG